MLVGIALLAPRGLAASCSPVLTAAQVYQIALNAGFPSDVATDMVAIAMRESSLCPTAHNPGTLGVTEDSYGLWQINVDANPQVVSALGLSDPSQLLDPNVNAAAAYMLWGGNNANLNTVWAINKTGPPYYYAEKYQANLPAAQAAAAQVGTTVAAGVPTFTVDVTSTALPSGTDTSTTAAAPAASSLASMLGGSVTIAGVSVPMVALVGGGLALLLLVWSLSSKR